MQMAKLVHSFHVEMGLLPAAEKRKEAGREFAGL